MVYHSIHCQNDIEEGPKRLKEAKRRQHRSLHFGCLNYWKNAKGAGWEMAFLLNGSPRKIAENFEESPHIMEYTGQSLECALLNFEALLMTIPSH